MWTNEQLEAINISDINTTVSASAGAGKTAVLVERLMKRILEDKVSVDSIVSLTFTDAAAAEMKNRLMQSLLEAYKKQPDNDFLYEQIVLLPSAHISTIHSFCLNLLKDYYYVLDLNPESLNNIMDDAEDLALHREAFDYVLAVYDPEKSARVMQLISASAMSINALNSLIKDLILHANSTIDPEGFLKESISIYTQYSSLNDLPQPFNDLFWTYYYNQTLELKTLIFDMLYELDNVNETIKIEEHQAWLNQCVHLQKECENALLKKDYSNFLHHFEALASLPSKTIRGHKPFTGLRAKYYDFLETLGANLYSEDVLLKQLSQNEEELEMLIEMSLLYMDYYKEGVKALNKITFNDMETLTYRLLIANDQEVAKEISETITDILVDEFQDTNELQNEIIKLISNGRNIFRVGDVKQSIYRFRGAQPEIMQALIEAKDSDDHKTIYLSNNFRSKEAIVAYNNHFFSKLMNLKSFDTRYGDHDVVMAGTQQQKEDSRPVELHRIHLDKEDEDLEGLNANQVKAHYIASQIVKLHHESDDKRWNRFTVLVNSHSRKLELKAAFDQANIPYFIALSDGLYTSSGVSTVVAYLKLVFDPSDKISLMAVLVNLYGYRENEITRHFLDTDKNLFKAADILDPNIMKQVYAFHYNQNDIEIADIVNHVFLCDDFYERKLSKQNRTNCDVFYDIVLNYDQQAVGVYGLLKEIEIANEAKTKEGSSISSEDNVVNVMTIHNSKGLQFETVFLMSKLSYRNNSASQGYLIHPKYGLAIKSIDLNYRSQSDNIANMLIQYFDKKEAIEEDMRVLYVALTRAQKELYIVDDISLKEDEPHEENPFNDQEVFNSSYTNWLESVHFKYPTQDLNYHIAETLEFRESKRQNPIKQDLKKFKPFEIKSSQSRNDFKVDKLSFDSDILATDIGTLVHNTMESIDLSNISEKEIKRVSPDLSPYYIKRIYDLGQDPFFKELLRDEVYREYPFIIESDNHRQRGIIDFFVKGKSTVTIVDFKTDNLEHEREFVERYKKQINFYGEALEKHFKDYEINKYIYSFKLQKFIRIV